MKRSVHILIAAALALMPGALVAADGQTAPADPQASDEAYRPVFTDGQPRDAFQPQFIGRGASSGVSDPIVRFGWWGTENSGSPTKIGEYQSLDSSPFFDVDGLSSDGTRTADYSITGFDNDGTRAGLNYFGPHVGAKIDYERYLRRLDHDPLANMAKIPPNLTTGIGYHTDLNVGQDYAIRVQEFDAKFKGDITENVKWRLNLWGMRKQGERQADAFAHTWGPNNTCASGANNRGCHVLSQSQKIDWLTTEIEPVIETKLGAVSVEYSRTMRGFTQDDQGVSRAGYAAPSEFFPVNAATQHPYAVVPDNYTQIDRLKFGVDLTDDTDLYALVYYGDTENKDMFTHRTFNGWDFRLTNRSIDGVTVTGYAKQHSENNQLPATVPEANAFPAGVVAASLRHPVDRDYTKAGLKARWLLGDRRYRSTGWSLAGGYEYGEIERDFVTFRSIGAPDAQRPRNQVFTQPNTYTDTIFFGPEWRVCRSLDTYVRYKMVNARNPLFGFRENQENVIDPANDTAVNTNQPQHVDNVEFGGTWTPADNFLLNATIAVERATHYSAEADFDEDSYPITFSAWWAPTQKLSLSAGLGFYSNWIVQDITIGTDRSAGDAATTTPWFYGGRADVVNLGANYAWTDRISLVGGMEFVRAKDAFKDPSSPGLSLTFLPGASDVIVETWRLTAGVDYLLSRRSSVYFRYIYYDYNDKSFARTASDPDPNSGTSNMFLGGLSATF